MIEKTEKKTESVRAEVKAEEKARTSKEKVTSAANAKLVEAERKSEKKHKRP